MKNKTVLFYRSSKSYIPIGVWSHIAISYDESTTVEKHYLNGNCIDWKLHSGGGRLHLSKSAVQLNEPKLILLNCEIHNNGLSGLWCVGGTTKAKNVLIHNNGHDGIICIKGGKLDIYGADTDSSQVYSNCKIKGSGISAPKYSGYSSLNVTKEEENIIRVHYPLQIKAGFCSKGISYNNNNNKNIEGNVFQITKVLVFHRNSNQHLQV